MADVTANPWAWSTTDANNSPSDATTIGAGLADNLQAIQAGVKAIFTPLASVAGTNTITATAAKTIASYASGQQFVFTPANANTGATTINIDSVGAKNIFNNGAALGGGELKASIPVLIVYDGTQFNIVGPFVGRNAALPLVIAYKGGTATDQTGDGTTYTITSWTEIKDQASNFNDSTGVFTAPVTGTYRVVFTPRLSGLLTTHTAIILRIATSNRNYDLDEAFTTANPFLAYQKSYVQDVDMDANDTLSVSVQVSGGTKVVDIYGAASPFTTLSIQLVA